MYTKIAPKMTPNKYTKAVINIFFIKSPRSQYILTISKLPLKPNNIQRLVLETNQNASQITQCV